MNAGDRPTGAASPRTPRRAVLVTGASRGLGAAIALELARRRFNVLGTYRDPAARRALESAGIVPVRLDVTDAASRSDALAAVEAALSGVPLWGLVNNAGVSTLGAVESLPPDTLRAVIEINLVGVIAMCQTFLPMLKLSGGRIVNISSVSSHTPVPFLGAYSASKAGLEAISDSLRQELRPSGVAVVVIRPGAVRTGLASSLPETPPGGPAGEPGPDGTGEPVRSSLERAMAAGYTKVRRALVADAARGLSPERVAEAVADALTAARPPARIVLDQRRWRARLSAALPAAWRDRRQEAWIWRAGDD